MWIPTFKAGHRDSVPSVPAVSHLSHPWIDSVLSLGPWWPQVTSMYFWMKIQTLSLSMCVPNSCCVRIHRSIFLPPYVEKVVCTGKCEAKHKEFSQVSKLVPMNYLKNKKTKPTLYFYHFYPTLKTKKGVYILSFLSPFPTIISLIIATQTAFTLEK